MPIYDYNCPKCGDKYDIWAKIVEYDLDCPVCGEKMKRLLSASNIICDIEPYLDGHMAQEPVPVFSRQDKARKLKERGLVTK
jgi:putative FmdB family regulatory protein